MLMSGIGHVYGKGYLTFVLFTDFQVWFKKPIHFVML